MFHYYDDDEEEYGFGFHDPTDLHRLMMLQRLMALQSMGPRRGEGSTTFMKGWSTRRSAEDKLSLKRSQSKVSAKIAPFFDMKEDHFADLVICNGSRRLYAHQLVVASWSDVLKQDILAERKKWTWLEDVMMPLTDLVHIELKIEDNEDTAIALENIFGFMYTETVELSLKTVWAHIRLALHYKVDELLVVCMQFIHSQLSAVAIRPFIVDVMNEAKSRAFTSTVVEMAMLRIQSELFFEEAEVVSLFDVDFLCDVLRSSDVIAKSEYDIFQKLKPKMAELMNTGKRRQVQRLLGLLRLTQMKTSELRELSSSEYMDVMREAFPEKLESALWSRALFNEQGFDEVPISLEMPRLYLEIPVPYIHEDHRRRYHYDDFEEYSSVKNFGFEQSKFNSMVFKIKDGEQMADQGIDRSEMPIRRQVPVHRITNGEHTMKKLTEFCQLEIPSGKFDFVTVNYKLPKLTKTTFKLLMVFLLQTQAGSKRRVFAHTDEQIETGVQCPIFPLPISEDCQATVTVIEAVCYTYDNNDHGKTTPRMSWDEALKLHYTTFKAT